LQPAHKAEERAAREGFYGNMVWVADGTRLQRDFPRFEETRPFFGKTSHEANCCKGPGPGDGPEIAVDRKGILGISGLATSARRP
jgi:hypothetical protein